jgi:DEAD/DEAH box helicase domain-containing protein
MAVADLLRLLKVNPTYRNRVVHINTVPPEEARYGQLETPLSPTLEAYLDNKNIRLYSHQCRAVDSIRAG